MIKFLNTINFVFNFGEFLNFCANFLLTFKIFQKYLINTFLLNVPPNQNFGDAIAVQDLSGIHVWNFVWCPPQPKSWSRYWYNCTLYITVVLEHQYSIWMSGNGNAVLCNYIDFDVIFQKMYSTNFIIQWLRAGPGRKNFACWAGNFGPVDISNSYLNLFNKSY